MNAATPRYRTGSPELDASISELVSVVAEPNRDFVYEMVVSAVRLGLEGADRGELKLVSSVLKELRHSFDVFAPYSAVRKCSVFGSARIEPGDPAYTSAHDFASAMASEDWMIITGAGPGIMQAGHEGAGADRSFGVNIVLPFETGANPVIAGDPKLINFRYFFTRKVMFMKESHGFALLPGGFGTLDEAFELLTLMQTGKTALAPVVLLDPPGNTYWRRWLEFVELELLDGELISPNDLKLVRVTDSVSEAVAEICRFYSTYHSMRWVGSRLILRLERDVSDHELVALNDRYGDIIEKGEIERTGATESELNDDDEVHRPRLALRFNRHRWARMRLLIDDLNSHQDL